jgi:hypothetical protein
MTLDNDQIKKLYLNPKFGLISINKFVEKLKLNYPDQEFKQNDIKEMVENLDAFQQFRKPKREIPLQVYANKNDSYMCDLIFYPKYKNQNKGYTTILTMIEMNTRKGFAIPIKSKGETDEAIEKFLKEGKTINVFQTDKGTEFTNNKMKKIYSENNIEHWIFEEENHNALGMIERFNRTIKLRIAKLFTSTQLNDWYSHLQDIIDNYNNTPHSALPHNKTPNQMTSEDIHYLRFITRNNNFSKMWNDELDTGDFVRIMNKKTLFQKEGAGYSSEIYRIVENVGFSYAIEDIETKRKQRRRYKTYELLKLKSLPEKVNIPQTEKITKNKEEITEEERQRKINKFLRREGLI